MEEEVWKTIPSLPVYEASNMGRIRRISNQRLLSVKSQDIRGYQQVSLYYNKKKYTKRVSRLVWEAFNGCACDKTIDHKDRDRQNDKLSNLRCVSASENSINRHIHRKYTNKYNLTKELKLKLLLGYRSGLLSTWDISKEYGIPPNYLIVVFKRRTWDRLLWKELNTKSSDKLQ